MNLANRVTKLEETTATKNTPHWLFVSVDDTVMSIMDVNHVYPTTIQNEDDLSTDEFLALATNHFGVDLAKEWNKEHDVRHVI